MEFEIIRKRKLHHDKVGYCFLYDDEFDYKNKWKHGKCDDPECEFCKNKPKMHPEKCIWDMGIK